MKGWQASTAGLSNYESMPVNAKKYIERMQELVGVDVDIISTGFRRDETIILKDFLSQTLSLLRFRSASNLFDITVSDSLVWL